MKATEKLLGELHSALAQTYLEQLKHYEDAGEPAPATLLTSIANFLRQNGIQAESDDEDTGMGELREQTKTHLNYPFDPESDTPH
jgi:hypothetical protein